MKSPNFFRTAAVLILGLLSTAPAHALVGDQDGVFGLDVVAKLRGVAGFSQLSEVADSMGDLYEIGPTFRLLVAGSFWDIARYEVHSVHALSWHGPSAPSGWSAAESSRRYRSIDTHFETVFANGAASWVTDLDRAAISLRMPFADLTVGRQAVTFASTWFWNPLDVFNPISAFALERDYKVGVDAIRLDIPVGDFSTLTLVGALGNTQHDDFWRESAGLIHFQSALSGIEFKFQGGRVYEGWHLGASFQTESSGMDWRSEVTYTLPDDRKSASSDAEAQVEQNYLRAVLGTGQSFANSFHYELEFYYNGQSQNDLMQNFSLVSQGAMLQVSKYLGGALISYEFHPLWRSQIATIVSLSDGSAMLSPSAAFSLNDEAEILVTAMACFGEKPSGAVPQSEFGTLPHVIYLELKGWF